MVTDFSGKDKASGVKFCTTVQGHPGLGISHFGELCFPIGRIGARWVDVESVCVDNRQSLSLAVLVVYIDRRWWQWRQHD